MLLILNIIFFIGIFGYEEGTFGNEFTGKFSLFILQILHLPVYVFSKLFNFPEQFNAAQTAANIVADALLIQVAKNLFFKPEDK